MIGGRFEHEQYRIPEILSAIEYAIFINGKEDEQNFS